MKNIIEDFTDIQAYNSYLNKHPDIIRGVKRYPNINCGNCLSDLDTIKEAGEIYEVTFNGS